jgi:hypothetical protein
MKNSGGWVVVFFMVFSMVFCMPCIGICAGGGGDWGGPPGGDVGHGFMFTDMGVGSFWLVVTGLALALGGVWGGKRIVGLLGKG